MRAAAPSPGVDEGAKALSGQEGKENEKKREKEKNIYIKKFYKNYKIKKKFTLTPITPRKTTRVYVSKF